MLPVFFFVARLENVGVSEFCSLAPFCFSFVGNQCRGVAQLVEHWFPKPAVGGSSPFAPANFDSLCFC